MSAVLVRSKIWHRFAINYHKLRACNMSIRSVKAHKLTYSEYGDPSKVVRMTTEQLKDVEADEVLVEVLAAPINPADMNIIQGTYPSRPALPAVPGNECVARIVVAGDNVKGLQAGDLVVPIVQPLGTWRTHAVFKRNVLYKVPKRLGLVEAATLTVNPCTAYRMLKDFVTLKPGDVVIQNGANSACGQNIIQLCKLWGITSVNVVRNRPNLDELRSFLTNLGATHVLTEEELSGTSLFKESLPKPKLALNCVGGKNALEMLRHLEEGGQMVTYGGMARQPVTVPVSALIFKDLQIRGYWMSRWSKENAENPRRFEMLEELIGLMCNGRLRGPTHEMVDFKNFQEALANSMTIKGMTGKKYVFDFGNK